MPTPRVHSLVALLLLVSAASAADKVPFVATQRLEAGPYEVTLPEKVGVLRAAEERVLAFEVPGRLERIADENSVVAAGDVLAELDSALERAQLRQAKLSLDEARSELARVQRLMRSDAVSQKALERAQTAAGLRLAERDVARERLERRRLLAPFAGSIVETLAEPGEVVPAGAAVATLMDLDALKVDLGIPGYQVRRVTPGGRVRISVQAFPGERFDAVVHRVADAAAEGGHLFELEVRTDSASGRLRPGMSARLRIVTETLPAALVVPLDVVVERDGQRAVFFVSEQRAHLVPVDGATLHGDRLLLPARLPYRDLVIRGQRDLRDGMRVRVDNTILAGVEAP
jgi:membrane fusion protein (multidrug efflux system)